MEKNKAKKPSKSSQKQLLQVLNLAQNPTIQQFFKILLVGYAYRLAKKHNLTS